jgi:hypothetical protein
MLLRVRLDMSLFGVMFAEADVLSKIRLSPLTGAPLLQLFQFPAVLQLLSVAPVQVQVSDPGAAAARPTKPNDISVDKVTTLVARRLRCFFIATLALFLSFSF